MAERDYYEILGVPRTATADEIKQAYRRLAKKYHPDRNRGDKTAEAKFKEVQSAYDVLGDPDKRRQYDQFGSAAFSGGPFGGQGGGFHTGPGGQRVYTWRGGGADIPIEDWEDLFSTFAGGGARGGGFFDELFGRMGGRRGGASAGPRPTPGQDAEHTVSLTFEQAIHGTTLDLRFQDAGGQPGSTVSVKIPPGVSDGQRIRLRGKGMPGVAGGPPGDLYIICQVQPHPYFRRVGDDIYIDLPLTITEAALGSRVEIPTLDGRTTLTVPPGTPSGAKLRLKGKGVQRPGKPPGDHYAVVRIVPPRNLTEEQRLLLERFRATGEPSPREDLGW